MWCIVTVSMETPSYLSIFIDTKKKKKNHHENDTFQHIMPYDTSNGRALRVLTEYQQFECVHSKSGHKLRKTTFQFPW